MNEEEWLTCDAPERLLEEIGAAMNQRKMRLYAAACSRRIWHLLDEDSWRRAIETLEQFADGNATDDERRAALPCYSDSLIMKLPFAKRAVLAAVCALSPLDLGDVFLNADNAVRALAAPGKHWKTQIAARKRVGQVERLAQTEFLRDIFGNPFRPIAFSASWRTDTVLSLAGQMYESRDFGAMPILADALQDAGCEDEAILSHCCDANQVHVRGCWVVDLMLGKS